jgi:hypothetical protein
MMPVAKPNLKVERVLISAVKTHPRNARRGNVDVIAESLRQLKASNPGLRLVVSFADPEQTHVGIIYQAGNWLYLGKSFAADEYIVNGKRIHGRSLRALRNNHSQGGIEAKNVLIWAQRVLDKNAVLIKGSSKHRYLMPLDRAMRRSIEPLRLPYPRAVEVSMVRHSDSITEGQVQSLSTALSK